MSRHFLYVGGRRVHYRRIGVGPPAVLVHPSPANSDYLVPLMSALAVHCTCFAFDNPGFGDSERLDAERITIADLADALAEVLACLDMPPCPVFGTHTGAAIAVELARRHPRRVRGLVLDALAIFTQAECDKVLGAFDTPDGGYMMRIEPDALGGHWARLWTRFRDQLIWFPWTSHAPADLLTADIDNPLQVHAWMMMLLRAGNDYRPGYLAAWTYGEGAVAALSEIALPAVYMARRRDMLFLHLDRFPPLKPGQTMLRLQGDGAEYTEAVRSAIVRFLGCEAPPGDRQDAVPLGIMGRRFAGGIFLREWRASKPAPAVLALHDVPGTSHSLEALIARLGRTRTVLAPDLPGTGDSALPGTGDSALPAPESLCDLDAFAQALLPVLDRLPRRFTLYGRGFGAALGVHLAGCWPGRVERLILDDMPLADEALAAELAIRLAPPIVLGEDGAHWFRTWQALRDSQIYWPWYRTRNTALRRTEGIFEAQALHDLTFEVMKQPRTYGRLVPACLAYPLRERLRGLAPPVLMLRGGLFAEAQWEAQDAPS